jgi:hypothetical protein
VTPTNEEIAMRADDLAERADELGRPQVAALWRGLAAYAMKGDKAMAAVVLGKITGILAERPMGAGLV